MQKTIYLTSYAAGNPDSVAPSSPLPAASIKEAVAMFPNATVVRQSGRLVILDVGHGARMAVSDYKFY